MTEIESGGMGVLDGRKSKKRWTRQGTEKGSGTFFGKPRCVFVVPGSR